MVMRYADVNWDRLTEEVFEKLKYIRACWRETERREPGFHSMMVRDLYQPALACLAEFCGCVEIKDDEPPVAS